MTNPYEVTYEPPDEDDTLPDADETDFLAMTHALDMVHRSLAAAAVDAIRDSDWERERDHYAEDMAIENRHPRKDAA